MNHRPAPQWIEEAISRHEQAHSPSRGHRELAAALDAYDGPLPTQNAKALLAGSSSTTECRLATMDR